VVLRDRENLVTVLLLMQVKHLVLLVLHDLPVGRLLGQQLPPSTLQDGLHGAEAGAHPRGQVEVLPLHRPWKETQHTHTSDHTWGPTHSERRVERDPVVSP